MWDKPVQQQSIFLMINVRSAIVHTKPIGHVFISGIKYTLVARGPFRSCKYPSRNPGSDRHPQKNRVCL